LVEWFAFRAFSNFWIFWKLSTEISIPFVPVSNFSEFFVEWKAPPVSEQVAKISVLNIGMA